MHVLAMFLFGSTLAICLCSPMWTLIQLHMLLAD